MEGSKVSTKLQVRFDEGVEEKRSLVKLESRAYAVRERELKRTRQVLLEKMRNDLPQPTANDIRRIRLPYHEALILELEEQGYVHSARFFADAIKYQEMYREKNKHDINIQSMAMLVKTKPEMNRLYERLMQAEGFHRDGLVDKELDVLLNLIVYYAFTAGPDWQWLAEQFFLRCMKLAETYNDDGGFRLAEARYFLGRHLAENRKDVRSATEALRQAYADCAGNYDWLLAANIEGYAGSESCLYERICKLLHRMYMTTVRATYEYDPAGAAELCVEARRIAKRSCISTGEALFYLARCYIELGRTREAVVKFSHASRILLHDNKPGKACKAKVGKATACLDLGRNSEALQTLQDVLHLAHLHDLPKYSGLANLYTGESHLNAGEYNKATEYLIKAANVFSEIKDIRHCHFVDTLACVSRGLEVYEEYVDLILDSDDPQSLARLLEWKDSRVLFHEETNLFYLYSRVSSFYGGQTSDEPESCEDLR